MSDRQPKGTDRPSAQHSDAARASANTGAAATSSSDARASAASAHAEPLKKCSKCSRSRPAVAFSSAQLKLGGRRQCRDCIEPTCAICGMHDDGRERRLRPVLVKRMSPLADTLIQAHYPCAKLLGGRLDQSSCLPSITGLPADLCALLESFCDKCHHGGVAVRCSGCDRVYHELCANTVSAARAGEKRTTAVFPMIIPRCRGCQTTETSTSGSKVSAASAVTSSAADIGTAAHVSASALLQLAAATSAADDSSSPPSSSDKSTSLSAAAEPAATTTTPTTPVAVTAAGSAPVPASSSAVAASAVSSSSFSSSLVDVAATLKKCSLCQRSLLESDYSSSQLKAKAKRQCKVCVTALQSARAQLPPGEEFTALHSVGQGLAAVCSLLDDSVESSQRQGIVALCSLLRACEAVGVPLHLEAATIARVMSLLRDGQSDQLRNDALQCVTLMALHPQLVSALVDASAIRVALALLARADLQQSHRAMCIAILRLIAESSQANCDALLAAGALAVLPPLVHPGISVNLGEELLPTLSLLMCSRPAAEMADAVARIGAVLMDDAAPPELLCACLDAFHDALASFADDHSIFDSWVESVLSAAPGMPQRLVQLLGDTDKADVLDAALALVVNMTEADTGQLRLLIDCGLLDKLAPLLNLAGDPEARLNAADLCVKLACTQAYAQLLVDSTPIVEALLALLSSAESDSELLRCAIGLLLQSILHHDRHMVRRLVDEHRALPPLVTALRRVIGMADKTAIFRCLLAVAGVLIVGDVEAADDDRGINPFIEPLDFQLGAFELVEPLQNHSDAKLAEVARRVFSYFIPNDCE